MQIYFVHRRKLTYVIILYLHCLKKLRMCFSFTLSFLMLLLDEYFFGPFDQMGILLRTCNLFFLVKGQSHYDIINLKNHCLYIYVMSKT